jgi:hypothetical protein
MDLINSLLNKIGIGKYITVDNKKEIKDLCEKLNDAKFESLKNELLLSVNNKKMTKTSKLAIDKLIFELKNNETLTIDDKNKLIEETINIIEDSNDDLEGQLDMKCNRYTKFTISNPAEYIRHDKNGNKYILEFNNEIIKKKDLKTIIEQLKEKIRDKNPENFQKIVPIKKIEYHTKKIIIYYYNNKFYFDINHTINLLNSLSEKTQHEKYDSYKLNIKIRSFKNNTVGGFYIKEYIDKETFFNILLHTNSVFSNKFKDNIAKLLDELTNNNMLIINNGELTIQTHNTKNNLIKIINDEFEYTQTFDNIELVNFIKNEIIKCQKESWNKYMKKHLIYFFVTTLDDPENKNRIICKIGYTYDLITRIKSLQNEYKSKFYLLNIKIIDSEQDEKNYHKYIKTKFPYLSIEYKIGNINKDELYIFDISLYNDFYSYKGKEIDNEYIQLEKEAQELINNYFDNISDRFEMELIHKMKHIICFNSIQNEYQQKVAIEYNKNHYEYLRLKLTENNKYNLEVIKEKNRHIEKIKELEFINSI